MRYKKGQVVYFIESGMRIREGWIASEVADRYVVRMSDEKDIAIRLPESRLYSSEEEAQKNCRTTGLFTEIEHQRRNNSPVRLH